MWHDAPMTAQVSGKTERALKAWKKGNNVYRHARRYGIATTTLYRALRRANAPR